MCLPGLFSPSIPKDNSAKQAQAAEAARESAINTGAASINSAFAGFNDPYYQNYEQSYEKNYLPQLQTQYDKARQKMILQLAGTGNLDSSAGASKLADLAGAFGDDKAQIASKAQAAANDLRNNVESRRSNLLQMNTDAADPGAAAANAASAASSLSAAPTYDPLGDAFASLLNQVPTGLAAEKAGYPGLGTGLFNTPSQSSTRVVS